MIYREISLRRTHHKADTLYEADKDVAQIFRLSGQTLLQHKSTVESL